MFQRVLDTSSVQPNEVIQTESAWAWCNLALHRCAAPEVLFADCCLGCVRSCKLSCYKVALLGLSQLPRHMCHPLHCPSDFTVSPISVQFPSELAAALPTWICSCNKLQIGLLFPVLGLCCTFIGSALVIQRCIASYGCQGTLSLTAGAT